MIFAKEKKNFLSGQTLIEVLLGLGIGSIVLGALANSIMSSLRNAQFAKNQSLVSSFASQGMEIVRQIRDKESLNGYLNDYCLGQDQKLTNSLSCSPNVGTPNIEPGPNPVYTFVRKVSIKDGGPSAECKKDTKYVVVSVSWWDNACTNVNTFCHKVSLGSCLVKQKGVANSL